MGPVYYLIYTSVRWRCEKGGDLGNLLLVKPAGQQSFYISPRFPKTHHKTSVRLTVDE